MGLNNMELGDSTLKVQRASIGMRQAAGVEMGVNAMAMMAGTTSADLEASRVLQLLNMVTPEELMDPEEYDGIFLTFRRPFSPSDSQRIKKSAKTFVTNARNSASWSTSRFPGPAAGRGRQPALERFHLSPPNCLSFCFPPG